MKKALTILAVLILVVGAVFAETQRLTLKSDVGNVPPEFILRGSETESDVALTPAQNADPVDATNGAEFAGGAIESDLSIADSDITVYFGIFQVNDNATVSEGVTSPGYARYNKYVDLAVNVGALTEQNPIDAAHPRTVAGSIMTKTMDPAQTYTGMQDGVSTTLTSLISTTNDGTVGKGTTTTTFRATYTGKVANQRVAAFSAKWLQDATLPNGTYKADITLTYSVQ